MQTAIPVKEVHLDKVEGKISLYGSKYEVTSFDEADTVLFGWAANAPVEGYDKVKFRVVFADEERTEYEGTYYLMSPDNKSNSASPGILGLRKHMADFLKSVAGSAYKNGEDGPMQSLGYTDEDKATAAKYLENFGLDLTSDEYDLATYQVKDLSPALQKFAGKEELPWEALSLLELAGFSHEKNTTDIVFLTTEIKMGDNATLESVITFDVSPKEKADLEPIVALTYWVNGSPSDLAVADADSIQELGLPGALSKDFESRKESPICRAMEMDAFQEAIAARPASWDKLMSRLRNIERVLLSPTFNEALALEPEPAAAPGL